ncbi:AAA family ATPase [Lepagella muris]|jgi:predicted ATPase|uniref:Uncharacterized protein n=1 Tax=Lepagella muris TaxID=3032870 RepID=A0AC61REY5_9BACT|nr:AAA family ATPase [Lepagella muris]ROT09365.1 hypothetical protein EEL33_02895 [Muribaculaceae bacterium Isolate-037 (Harlan)]TGY78332.1 hypothetical protein E5331_10645 [Lepagella muris]THG49940.1 hypothetical protein E5984_14020 [Bacteroidales bacterium]TKC57801.1 hypothetical protein E5359_011450 [Bacteroidales bacterium]
MIISKLVIGNFRSYYGEKIFEFKRGLNLILGSNGDGKTTFYDALEFVLGEQNIDSNVYLRSCISAKMLANLAAGEKGEVKVSLEMQNNANQKRYVERSFDVVKGDDGAISISNVQHLGYVKLAIGRKSVPVSSLLQGEALFPAVIKKYSLFKGERALNIFEDKTTLQNLINLFSDIKEMDPYIAFSRFAEKTSEIAVSNAQKKNKQTGVKAANLMEERSKLEKKLKDAQARLETLQKNYLDTNQKIESIESDFDTIELVHSMQDALKQVEIDIETEKSKLRENYSVSLLDDLWILEGFQPILESFAEKMTVLSEQKQTLINLDKEAKIRRQAKIEAEQKTIEEFKAKLVQLPWYIPDVKTMQSMLEKEVCLVCGSKAVKGSDAYNHIASRLQEALEHLAPKKEIIDNSEESKEDTILFIGKSIDYIHQLSIQLYNYGKNISEIKYEIENVKLGNEKIQNHISKKYEQADSIRTKIAQILAQSKSGNDIGGMVGNWSNIKHWFSDKESISVEIDRLTTKIIPQIKESIRQNIEEYKKCAVSSAAKEFLKINNFFRLFSNALENAEERGLEEFMGRLAESANKFLSILNVDDFTGIIRIYRDIRDNAVRVKLIDKSGKIIENPNTSLYTTMHLSVLFAISELTKDNFDNDYPLILDAPTSSFDEGKDKTFYQVMNERLNKQCIVVTKSFLVKDEDTERFIIDEKGLRKLLSVRQIPVYRIEKMIGFDKQDLSSIETIVTPIYY